VFKVYRAFDPDAPTKTWDSIQRANDPAKTDALRSDPDLLRRFLVFADIGDGFAAIDRQDGTVWSEDGETSDLSQLSMPFEELYLPAIGARCEMASLRSRAHSSFDGTD